MPKAKTEGIEIDDIVILTHGTYRSDSAVIDIGTTGIVMGPVQYEETSDLANVLVKFSGHAGNVWVVLEDISPGGLVDSPPVVAPDAAKTEFHRNKFKVGYRVKVIRKSEPPGFQGSWVDSMDETVGHYGTIVAQERALGGYVVQLEDNFGQWMYPSTSLRKATKRRVRVGPGPWNAAPCSHLRWNLMAFFRDKLSLSNDTTVTCNKCGTSMELHATKSKSEG